VTIGANRYGGGAPTEFIDASIDDLRVYPRALNASEVQAVYQEGQ
jgi:hypothetical protein